MTRLDRERLVLMQKNEAMIEEKIKLIQTNNEHEKKIEEMKAELGGAQFTINTLRSTFDIHCVNYDDDDGNDCTTFIQFSHQETYGTSLLQELNDLSNGSIIHLENSAADNNDTSNIHEESTGTCIPINPAEDSDNLDTLEESIEMYQSPNVTILNHTRAVSPSLEPRPVTYDEIIAYDEYWRQEKEEQCRAKQSTTINPKKQATATHKTQSSAIVPEEIFNQLQHVQRKLTNVTSNVDQNTNVYLIGDSIAKSIIGKLADKLPSGYDLIDYSKGGMTTINANKLFVDEPKVGDIAVLIVGTNDLFKTQWEDIKKAYISLFDKLQKCKQTVPTQSPTTPSVLESLVKDERWGLHILFNVQ
ncbi:hypothetical protein WDU94_005560 [Cyamophila willieti]